MYARHQRLGRSNDVRIQDLQVTRRHYFASYADGVTFRVTDSRISHSTRWKVFIIIPVMPKKSSSRSAFIHLRVVIGFGIFLLGVLLALVGVVTPSGSGHRFVATKGTTPTGVSSPSLRDLTDNYAKAHATPRRDAHASSVTAAVTLI